MSGCFNARGNDRYGGKGFAALRNITKNYTNDFAAAPFEPGSIGSCGSCTLLQSIADLMIGSHMPHLF